MVGTSDGLTYILTHLLGGLSTTVPNYYANVEWTSIPSLIFFLCSRPTSYGFHDWGLSTSTSGEQGYGGGLSTDRRNFRRSPTSRPPKSWQCTCPSTTAKRRPSIPRAPQHLAIARKRCSLTTMTQKQSRKRPKSWRGCTICRAARRKCTEEHPRCAHCERNKLDCQVPPHCAPWAGDACASVGLMVV